MAVRPAKFGDIPAIADLLKEAHGRSKYASLSGFDMKAAKGLAMHAIQRHGLLANGGACAFVVDTPAAIETAPAPRVQGFLLGIVQPLYLLGDALEAQDLHFLCANGAPVDFVPAAR